MDDIKPKGFFTDPEGDFSSGRLIKVIAIITASVLALASVVLISIVSSHIFYSYLL